MNIIAIIIGCLFTSNIILSSFLGVCPFLGLSKNPKNAFGMGLALTFVVTMSAIICYFLEKFILAPLKLDYLQLIIFILVIASFVQFVEFFMKKYLKGLYNALGIYLPLITTNCIVLFVAQKVCAYTILSDGSLLYNYSFLQTIIYALFTSIGYMMVITLFSFVRVRIIDNNTYTPFKGNAIALITMALLAMVFAAFTGLV